MKPEVSLGYQNTPFFPVNLMPGGQKWIIYWSKHQLRTQEDGEQHWDSEIPEKSLPPSKRWELLVILCYIP